MNPMLQNFKKQLFIAALLALPFIYRSSFVGAFNLQELSPGYLTNQLNNRISPFTFSGEYWGGFGFFSKTDSFSVAKANFDQNERNWRLLFGPDKFNTFDPGIFNRFEFSLDTNKTSKWNFHTNLTFDPWSYTGKTDKSRITTQQGDMVDVQYFWSASNDRTLAQKRVTVLNGDRYEIPEIGIHGGQTAVLQVDSYYATQSKIDTNPSNNFDNYLTIPEMKVKKTFQPLRELWVSYRTDETEFMIFPMAYQSQAMVSNDPLGLVGKKIYWEPSPWTQDWVPGQLHIKTDATALDDFSQGYWSSEIARLARDSQGRYLTALRGVYLLTDNGDNDFFEGMVASPKSPWQAFNDFTALPGSIQKRFPLGDKSSVGFLYNFRFGFVDNKQDAFAQAVSMDTSLEITPPLKLKLQGVLSQTKQDQLSDYQTKKNGGAIHAEIDFTPSELDPLEGHALKISYSKLNKDFNPVLSSYRETRDDQYWGRHIYFDSMFEDVYTDLFVQDLSWDQVMQHRIGDGIDSGRNIFRFSDQSTFFHKTMNVLIDVRHVTNHNGDDLETVSRFEASQDFLERFTASGLFYGKFLPKTTAGVDPFYRDPITDEFAINAAIPGNVDPSAKTFSGGLQYRVFDWLSVHGIYERTNNYENFPRVLLSNSDFKTTVVDSFLVRKPITYLYDQRIFPLPPYPYYNVYRAGIASRLGRLAYLNLGWTRNDFTLAGPVDNNINHYQTTLTVLPMQRLRLKMQYAYTMMADITENIRSGDSNLRGHSNFAAQINFRSSENTELFLQYGAAGFTSPDGTSSFNPVSDNFPVLDTQDFIKVMFRGKF